MNEEKFNNEEEKEIILNKVKNKGIRGIIIKQIVNSEKGSIKY